MRNFVYLFVVGLLATGCIGSFLFPIPAAITGDPERGQQIFTRGKDGSPPCSTCHYVAAGQTGFSLGPSLAGIGERAGTRIEGVSAEDYLHQSILEPRGFVVPGYRDLMYPNYDIFFSEQDLQDLIAYTLTL